MVRWDARDYHSNSTMQQQLALALLDTIPLRGDEQVLDIGCGDGKLTAEIARRAPRGSVLGIDLSEEMIGFAMDAYPPAAASNLAFQVCDATRLPFRETFDLAVSFATLHWIADHPAVLRGVERGLRSGGRLVFQCGGRGNLDELTPSAEVVMRAEKWRAYFEEVAMPWSFYGPAEYEDWLLQAGLTPRRVELVPKMARHAGQDGLTAWIRTTWLPYLQRLPEELRSELAGEIAQEYVKSHPPDREGCVQVPMIRLEVEATKA